MPYVLLIACVSATQALAHQVLPSGAVVAKQGERWLAGDHHVHSRYSVDWNKDTSPPTPIMGGDAIYPIPMNAVMGRRHGLDWMVTTDHGGPNHSRIHLEHAYPELLESRAAVPDLVQFYGMEFDTPGADHSSIIMPHSHDEATHLHQIESRYNKREPWPEDTSWDTEPRMIEALEFIKTLPLPPVLIAHHPSRSATGLGEYGKTGPAELRAWNDTAPGIAVAMEGAPGHQAAMQMRPRFGPSNHAKHFGERRPRGAYRNYPTMGGYDQMTARVGGFWDSMLGEGRRWWITATSDSHIHWTDGGIDFWPGEYSKTYVLAEKSHDAILASLRAGRVFVSTGDLVSELWVSARAQDREAGIGGTLKLDRQTDVVVEIRFLDPETRNAHGDNPAVQRVDLILGQVGKRVRDRSTDTHAGVRVDARFSQSEWTREGPYRVIRHTLKNVRKPLYLRVRGTNTAELEPAPDVDGEDPWQDLWFYSNPIFVTGGK
ncbi:MAG: phosphoesterase [Panacagrimonas sp.]